MLTDPVKKTKGNTKAIKIASDCGNLQEQEPVEHHDWALAGEEGDMTSVRTIITSSDKGTRYAY
jgi:hypothetical protein